MRFIKSIFNFIFLMTFSISIYAQDPLNGKDLSQLKVDALTENQINAIQQKLKQSGMKIDQIESQAIAKGMSPEEFSKFNRQEYERFGKLIKQANIKLMSM